MKALRLWQRLLLGFTVAILLAALVITGLIRGSLPRLDGERRPASLAKPVEIERDALGTPTIRGATRADVAYGLGFAHAQDRYFQMDLSRRAAAGELAALFGARLVERDRDARRWRFRAAATQVLADATAEDRAVIAAYTQGVNAGLADLTTRPFEYWLLRLKPSPWRAEDSVLVVYAMWWDLQHTEIGREQRRQQVLAAAPAALAQFLYRRGTSFDAPIAQTGPMPAMVPVPGPEVFDLRAGERLTAVQPAAASSSIGDPIAPGSNNWAIAGSLTATGAALVANDMHLGLGVPAVWYRARLVVAGETAGTTDGEPRLDAIGVTLPGAPSIVAGSNHRIAWGFTNSYGDWSDVKQLACSQLDLLTVQETIAVQGGDSVPLSIRVPRDPALGHQVVLEESADGQRCTLASWLARARGATNLRIFDLEQARSVGAALELLPTVGIPQQNVVIGDRSGRIAWSILGRLPRGEDAERLWRPIDWRDVGDHPTIVNPAIGRVWSANARTVDGPLETVLGSDEVDVGVGYAFAARARQIRDRLLAIPRNATPADMLAIQLDDRAVALSRWRDVLLGVIDDAAVRENGGRAELRRFVERWDARADVDSVGYRLVRAFHDRLMQTEWAVILSHLKLTAEDITAPAGFEAALWQLVNEQPQHFLPPLADDWRSFLLSQVDATQAELLRSCESLARCTWGSRTPVAIRHPLSQAVPLLSHWLDMPTEMLAGDNDMPRVQVGAFGASERFAVSPGAEEEGYLQLAGGQSAHPLSPFYRAGFDDWARGRPTPFLPGLARHKLVLLPSEPAADREP
ncbi:MAG: penicillin acylase family protein [Proteobacteria bacterium]|nr:penicillin acylase family protein [Pseudomonadota bacterium]